MSPAAPAIHRRSLLQYAIGFDLVIIAVGIGLLVPPRSWLLLAPFVTAVGIAAVRGGWRVGLATTGFSLIALAIVFPDAVPFSRIALFTLAAVTTTAFLGAQRPQARPPSPEWEEELARAHRALILPLLVYGGLPILVFVTYTNISDVLIRNFGVPSILQPLIGVLAIAVLRYWKVFRPDSVVLQPLTIGLVAYCLFVFTSSNWARDVAAADGTLVDLLKSLAILIVPASLIVSWKALRLALITVAGAAVVLSIITLAQVASGNPELQFGGFAELEVGHVFGDVDQPRPAGPVGDTNYFARILVLALPLAAFLGVGRESWRERAGYAAGAVLIALAILFTYSRGAMLAVAAVAVLLLLAGRIRLNPATVVAALLVVVALIPTPVGQRMATLASLIAADEHAPIDHSTDKRRQLLEVGWLMFNDHPVFGVGAGNFGARYPAYANIVGWSGVDYIRAGVRQYPHNQYLEVAVETGIAGLLVFVATMIIALAALYRSRGALLARGEAAHAALATAIAIALAGYLVASVFLHSGYHRYLWLFLGFAAAAVRLTSKAPQAREDGG